MNQRQFQNLKGAQIMKDKIVAELQNYDVVTFELINQTVSKFLVVPALKEMMTRWIESLVTITIELEKV